MGEEIVESHFTADDFAEFERRLGAETALLGDWMAAGRLSDTGTEAGFELEAWLLDAEGRPAPIIDALLSELDDPFIVPELATFNLEINGTPRTLRGKTLSDLANELQSTWARCAAAAARLGARLCMVGILPSVRASDLALRHMTPRQRYRALNDQVLKLRRGRPLTLHIEGRNRLELEQSDVMLESGATSFQIHIKVDPACAHIVYNWSKILAAPMVAVSANSPYLFGLDLWDETRIPLFEQAVSVGGSKWTERVNFGIQYAAGSIMDCFRANVTRYQPLLPQLFDDPSERLSHLRLHNGTIWRWNRPLIGFDADGTPHVRIEHRVVPAGPTVSDCIANAALYYGAVHEFSRRIPQPEGRLPFENAKANFYNAARYGLGARVDWLDGRTGTLNELLRDDVIAYARSGLLDLGIDAVEIDHWLGVIAARLASGQTGAQWQRDWVAHHGCDLDGLTASYLEWQASGRPVHEWSLGLPTR